MDHRRHPPGTHRTESATRRRARSYSQPIASPVPGPSSGSSHRPPDPFDFLNHPAQSHPPHAGPSTAASSSALAFPPFGPPPDFDDDALFRSLLSMTDDQLQGPHPPLPHHFSSLPNLEHMPFPPLQSMQQLPTQQQMAANPLLSQTFVAWLQYMQLQMHLQQQQQQHGQSQPQQTAHAPPPQLSSASQHQQQQQQQHHLPPHQVQQGHSHFQSQSSFTGLAHTQPTPAFPRSPPQQDTAATNTPSPEAEMEGDSAAIAEEKRRRNTAASARFRVKKKQWTSNLERSITDLSGRVEELEREAAELRRENGWLKEIVMLKSKRYGAPAPDILNELNAGVPGGEAATPSPTESQGAEAHGGEKEKDESSGKGKEVQR